MSVDDETPKEPRAKAQPVDAGYTKDQFFGSQQFTNIEKDFLSALLQEERTYTVSEANNLLADFKAKEAK